MSRLLDIVVPTRLGVGFRFLLGSTVLACIGDGMALAAGPLLVSSLTRNAFLVALAALLQWLPPLLFALVAGVVSDRVDRVRLVVATEVARALVVGVLALTLLTGHGSIAAVLVVMFLLGTLEVFSNNTSSTLLPMIVASEDLPLANARLQIGFVTLSQFVGPPLGALLFGIGRAVPFAGQAILVGFGALLVARIVLPERQAAGESHWRRDVVEGVIWTARHPAVRTLVLTILIFNVTFGAAWSVLVLYATRRLGVDSFGFGLLNAAIAAGGIVANLLYARITARISLGSLMRLGLVIETLVHLFLALTRSPWVAGATLFCFGFEAFAWGTTSITVRQRAVPSELQGRVNAVNTVGSYAGLVAGAGLGGVIAQGAGVVAPFWFAFAGSAVFLVVMWRRLSHITHQAPASPRPVTD